MKSRIIVVVVFLVLVGSFFYFDVGQYLSLEYIKSQQAEFDQRVQENPAVSAAVYFVIYIAVTSLSLPGAAIMTLAGGAIFGLWWGVLLVSFASTIGATLAMLVSRFVLRDQVMKRFSSQLKKIDRGIETDGAFYLFTLRLVPAFPFWVINLLMGLTKISVPVYVLVSQVGMLAATVVFVNAGTQLAKVETLGGILSPGLIASFVLLGFFPLVAKKISDQVKATRLQRVWPKPKIYDRDVVVIGAGSGGLVAALIVATVKGKVTLIEKNKMGGDCLNTGCVPSKSLIRSAKLAWDIKRGKDLGFQTMQPAFEFADVMQRVHRIIKTIEPHDSVERYQSLGVDCEIGEGRILSPYSVEVNGKILTTRSIIIASGAGPLVPPFKGLDQVDYLTSENIWELDTLPDRLVVLGGGPIGTELTQAFTRLGSQVTQVEATKGILSREDPEISEMMIKHLKAEGANVLTDSRATEVIVEGADKFLLIEIGGKQERIAFDQLIIALGRKASVTGFGLEELGIEITERGTVAVDEYLRTNYPNIYAIGDVAGPYQFTHTASHMAWYAAVN
ncbi:MAG: FAD-dependent oxidoreductase, partial [bacterium]